MKKYNTVHVIFSLILTVIMASCHALENNSTTEENTYDKKFLTYLDGAEQISSFLDREGVMFESLIAFASELPTYESYEIVDSVLFLSFAGGYDYMYDIAGKCWTEPIPSDVDSLSIRAALDSLTLHYGLSSSDGDVEVKASTPSIATTNQVDTKATGSNIPERKIGGKGFAIWCPWKELRKEDNAGIKGVLKAVHGSAHIVEYTNLYDLVALSEFSFVFIASHGTQRGEIAIPRTMENINYLKRNKYEFNYGKTAGVNTLQLPAETMRKLLGINKYVVGPFKNTIVWTSMCYAGNKNSELFKVLEAADCADFFGAVSSIKGSRVLELFSKFYPSFITLGKSSKDAFKNYNGTDGFYRRGSDAYRCVHLNSYAVKPVKVDKVGYRGRAKVPTYSDNLKQYSVRANTKASEADSDDVEAGLFLQNLASGETRYIPFTEEVITNYSIDEIEDMSIVSLEIDFNELEDNTDYSYTGYVKYHNGVYELTGTTQSFHTDESPNVIYYTTTDGKIIDTAYWGYEDITISNTYINGVGRIVFSSPVTVIITDYNFGNLKSIYSPTVISIKERAFWCCTSLESVSFPTATTIEADAFICCTSLASIDLPSATTIGRSAFSHCTSLASIDLPSATTIGEQAFWECTNLASIDLPVATTIGEGAFLECTNLASIDLPSATTIGGGAFSNCTSLASIDLPSATTIGGGAFSNCTSLASIDLPVATTIGKMAFLDCTSLASIDLPSATTIGEHAFRECTNLASINLPSATTIGEHAFRECTNLASIDLPSATTIETDAFIGCTSLASIDLPVATTIGRGAFLECTNLENVNIPVINTISGWAFVSSSKLTIVIPETCCNCDGYAFNNATIYLHACFPISLLSSFLYYHCKIYVPASWIEEGGVYYALRNVIYPM